MQSNTSKRNGERLFFLIPSFSTRIRIFAQETLLLIFFWGVGGGGGVGGVRGGGGYLNFIRATELMKKKSLRSHNILVTHTL